jgi:hypothetical protein
LAQGGAPDFSLVYFFWEKNKVITTLKNMSTIRNPIAQVSFHPKGQEISGENCGVFNFTKKPRKFPILKVSRS